MGRVVQVASVRMPSSFSRSGRVGEAKPGNFNFEVGTGGLDMNIVEMDVWRHIDRCLGQVWIIPWRCHYWEEPGGRRV